MSATVRTHPEAPRIAHHWRDGVSVICPIGALDAALTDEVRHLALEAHAPVVVDLGECVLIDPSAVQRIAKGWEFYRPDMCIVCPRPGARQLLQRAGVTEELAVFETVEQALGERPDPAGGGRWLPASAGAA